MPSADDPALMHANPYGQTLPTDRMPPPIAQPPSNNQSPPQNQYTLSPEQIAMLQQMPPQMLPSRDMPTDAAGYAQDVQSTKPNYIPPSKRTDDYIAKYEQQTEAKAIAYEKEKRRNIEREDTLDKIQMPIFLFILYFIFQMHVVNNFIFKQFSFLAIHNELGNLNFNGICFKSMLFCATFYSINYVIEYLSDI